MFVTPGSRGGSGGSSFPQMLGPAALTVLVKNSSQAISAGVAFQPAWDTVLRDDVRAFSSAVNTQVQVPYGYTRARHWATIMIPTAGLSGLGNQWLWVCLNGTGNALEGHLETVVADHRQISTYSRWFEGLLPSDTFTIRAQQSGGGTGFMGPSGSLKPMWGIEWMRG